MALGLLWMRLIHSEIDVGLPFQYFIPSTLYDEEVDEQELKARTALIEVTFLSNYGGVTIDTWTAKFLDSGNIVRSAALFGLDEHLRQGRK